MDAILYDINILSLFDLFFKKQKRIHFHSHSQTQSQKLLLNNGVDQSSLIVQSKEFDRGSNTSGASIGSEHWRGGAWLAVVGVGLAGGCGGWPGWFAGGSGRLLWGSAWLVG